MIIALQTLIFFRESLFSAIDRLLRPYYKHFSLTFNRHGSVSDDEESEDHVFAEFDDEKGVVFFPPMYAQRYAAVTDCLMDERWSEKLEKVVDLGYHDMSFIKYLKEVPGIKNIMGVDLESMSLRCSSDLLGCDDYIPKRETPLQITLYQGNAADPDYRLIGCDAVIAIEMIEHMLPHDLDRLVHTIFGFIKPWIAVITTPNGDFNPLFKKLERNGLRRLDHFFEWSREQFHDWCSNIVARYPQYTVSCQGIGPGPAGTEHYGCCSQLALFVAKDYHKQQDLDLNSMALVAQSPTPTNVYDMIDLDSPITLTESNMICAPNNIESYPELVFSNKQSCISLVLASAYSLGNLEYRDKTAQCNLDTELGKNFLMFDEEPCFDVLVPRKIVSNRVYVIEDVYSRLNCTTLQVKKFSKKTQNMLAKDKMDHLIHTREVVDDIKHLTKMLNFDKEMKHRVEGDHVWYNINWGDNAPYWNQYYKPVREFKYPFEVKSEECRILDLISDEINRLIDTEFEEEFTMDANKVEIPIQHLMRVVQHVTDDVEKVKDLLEWNGYEVSEDVVIYSRLAVDGASAGSRDDDWRDDAFSDWDTDVHSTSVSDGSTIMQDYNGRCLHRALEHKVRKLRSMLSADEDIGVELDAVVCRLLKLALRTTRNRQSPLSMKWLQCKLLELLTLTEKAIEKKKQHFVKSYPLKAICYGKLSEQEELDLTKIKEDKTANNILHKYRHLVQPSDNIPASEVPSLIDIDLSYESSNQLLKQTLSSELTFGEIVHSPSNLDIEPIQKQPIIPRRVFYNSNETPITRTQAWIEDDHNAARCPKLSYHAISSGDTDHSMNDITRIKNKKYRKPKLTSDIKEEDIDIKRRKKSSFKTYDKHKAKNVEKYKNKDKTSKTRLIKKVVKKKSSYNVLIKTCSKKLSSADFGSVRSYRNQNHNGLRKSISKPIPENVRHICLPEEIEKCVKELNKNAHDSRPEVNSSQINLESNIAKTEESLLIDIVTDDKEETIALRRTIGTDADDEPAFYEQETVLGSLMNVMKADSFYNKHDTENVHSQTIFIYDINEPSTSKGVRHVSMDVQCGPDATNTFATLSATTSFTRMPKIFNTGIKIGDSSPNIQMEKTSTESGTSTNEPARKSFKTISPRVKPVGIRIKDSDTIVKDGIDSITMTHDSSKYRDKDTRVATRCVPNSFQSPTRVETQLLKSVSSQIKMEDSGSEFCESICSSPAPKSPYYFSNLSKNTSDFQLKSSLSKDVKVERKISHKYVRPKLSCGGVHVHSYKDRQTSEDVVYQGEWQRYRPKILSRRRPLNASISKRVNELEGKKSKANSKECVNVKDVKLFNKRITNRNVNHKKSKEIKHEGDPEKRTLKSNFTTKIIQRNSSSTKLATKTVTSSLVPKSNKVSFVTKKPSKTLCIKKDIEKPQKCCRKSYLPVYLKRKLASNKIENLTQQTNSTKTVSEIGKEPTICPLTKVVESDVDGKNNLLESLDLIFEPRENVSYVVFRNETDQNPTASSDIPYTRNIGRETSVRSPSPQSQNSSPYSSPSSIATVKVRPTSKVINDRRFSTSSNKSNLSNSQSESAPVKTKKFTKRAKSSKKSQEKDNENKENVPESSKRSKESEKSNKISFVKNKNVYRAHLTSECSPPQNSVSRNRPQTNVRLPTVPCSSGKQSSNVSSRPSASKKCSPKSSSSVQSRNRKHEEKFDFLSMTNQREDDMHNLQSETNEGAIINIVDNSLLSEWMNSTYKNVDSHTSTILGAMRQLVEERLDFIEQSSDNLEVDSKTVVLSDKIENATLSASASFHDCSSLNNSIGSVNKPEENYSDINIQNVLNNTLGSLVVKESLSSLTEPQRTSTDLDLLSGMSEYYLAESSLNNVPVSRQSQHGMLAPGSVRDLFERKNQLLVQHPTGVPGALAVQVFSGFSMNAEPLTGDQPDRVNIIDSETGSFSHEFNRQTTSEELFISGRSSDSYESCLIDEDSVVPYWLFQRISQQPSVEEDPEPMVAMPLPIVEPDLDMNGNAAEPGMGAGAGAGDGRGIHSDNSQDSSGRGTSLSSSATSSEPQSEAILIDPIAYTAHYDLTREPNTNTPPTPALPLDLHSPDTSYRTAEGPSSNRTNDIINSSGEGCERAATSALAASDVDADVSSIDTDVPDSSDN